MLKIQFLSLLLLCLFVPVTQAKDVSAQQAGYNNALQRVERAEAEAKADAQAVAETEMVIEKKTKQLAEEKKKADISSKKLLDAKDALDQAQKILDKAWKD
jgi:hypothetical protein